MNDAGRKVVHVRRLFGASPQRVFDAWLDPGTAGRWLFATSTGKVVRVEIDARVGGSFLFVRRQDGEDIEHTGEYLELDRPRHIVFSFAVPKYSAESTRVTIEITPLDTGCELSLTHENVDPHYVTNTERGWATLLDGLAALLV